MMENPRSEEETLIKDIRNLFRRYRILRDIKKLFEHEEEQENYYKPVTRKLL